MRLVIILLLCQCACNSVLAACRDITLSGLVDQNSLWRDLNILAADDMHGRQTGRPGAAKARDFIASRFKDIGLISFEAASPYLRPFKHSRWLSEFVGINVVGWLPGSEYRDEFIVITAHYDHIGTLGSKVFNGADDNASGVAALLAIASQVQMHRTKHSVLFVATDAEERGLFGAKAFVSDPPVAIDSIKYNLNLDMLAQGGRRHRLYVSASTANAELSAVVQRTKEEAGLCLVSGHKRAGFGSSSAQLNWRKASDHAAFASKGIAYLFVGVDVHPDYHTVEDDVDKIDVRFFTAASETALRLLRNMDKQ